MKTTNTPADPLANLRDIHLPPEVGSWPPAPGWWILSVVLLAALAAGIYLWYSRRSRSLYRRQALQLLEQLHQSTQSPAAELAQINQLLKRVALKAYPNRAIASVNGRQWVNFLHSSAPMITTPENLSELLSERLYAKVAVEPQEVSALFKFARDWINQHLPESKLSPTDAGLC